MALKKAKMTLKTQKIYYKNLEKNVTYLPITFYFYSIVTIVFVTYLVLDVLIGY